MKKSFIVLCVFLFATFMAGCSSGSSSDDFISEYDNCLSNIESNERIDMTVTGNRYIDGVEDALECGIIAEDNPISINKSTKTQNGKEIIKVIDGKLVQFFPNTNNNISNPIVLGKPEDFTLADLGVISGDHTDLGLKTNKIVKRSDEYYISGSGRSILEEGALISLYNSFGISDFAVKQLEFRISIVIEEDLLVFDIYSIGKTIIGNVRVSMVIVLKQGQMYSQWDNIVSDFSSYKDINLGDDISIEVDYARVKIELEEGQYVLASNREFHGDHLEVYDRTRMISKNVHFVGELSYLYNIFSVTKKGTYYFKFPFYYKVKLLKCDTNFFNAYELTDNVEYSGTFADYEVRKYVYNASEDGLLKIDNVGRDRIFLVIFNKDKYGENRFVKSSVARTKTIEIKKGENIFYIYSGSAKNETEKNYAFKVSATYE